MAEMAKLDEYAATLDHSATEQQKRDYYQLGRLVKQVIVDTASHFLTKGLHALGPLALALSPWLAAAKSVSVVKRQMQLYDLLPVEQKGKNLYACSCHKCVEILEWVIDKREYKALKTGVAATVVGLPFVLGYSGVRTLYKKAKGTKGKTREQYAMHLQKWAMPIWGLTKVRRQGGLTTEVKIVRAGCRKAQAITAIMMGELSGDNPSQNVAHYEKTVSAMVATNGWVHIKSKMYTGPF